MLFVGCEREFDSPPVKEIPVGSLVTIDDLRNMHEGKDTIFTSDLSLYAVVTADETNGNIYKNIFVQDETGAINLGLQYSGGLYQGDSIRIYLKNTILRDDNGMIVIDSVDVDEHIIKQKTGAVISPMSITIDKINSGVQSYLIKLDDVEFISSELGQTYADAVNLSSSNLTLEDCNGNQVILRSSGYSSIAKETIPSGNGSIIAVIGEYQGDMQLYIRDITEVDMEGTRCDGTTPVPKLLSKNFDDGSVTSGGWTNYWTGTTANGTDWGEWDIFGGDVGACSNFDISTFTNYATTSWLISPAVDLDTATAPILTFDNTYRYDGSQLELYVSTDYTGSGDPASTGTWTSLSSLVTWNSDDSSWDFTASGNIDLSSYKSSATYIAFKYSGTNSTGSTWELDNIIIDEQ